MVYSPFSRVSSFVASVVSMPEESVPQVTVLPLTTATNRFASRPPAPAYLSVTFAFPARVNVSHFPPEVVVHVAASATVFPEDACA